MIFFIIKYNTNVGNWLFQYAAALRTGADVGIVLEDESKREKFVEYASIFGGLQIVKMDDVKGLPVYKEPEFRYHELPQFEGDMVLDGFFQSEKYFDATAVRARFGVTAERESELRDKYGDWLNRPNVTGISVRHGQDYLDQCAMHPFVGKRYFREAIAKLPECRDFIVCSDDLPWCKDWFPKSFSNCRFLFVEGESVLNQLYLQSLCQNNVVSNSSFSWWGAWLNANPRKKVFAPSLWFGPMARYLHVDWRDLYFAGMTVLRSRPTVVEQVCMWSNCLWRIFKIEAVKARRRILAK